MPEPGSDRLARVEAICEQHTEQFRQVFPLIGEFQGQREQIAALRRDVNLAMNGHRREMRELTETYRRELADLREDGLRELTAARLDIEALTRAQADRRKDWRNLLFLFGASTLGLLAERLTQIIHLGAQHKP